MTTVRSQEGKVSSRCGGHLNSLQGDDMIARLYIRDTLTN